LTVLILAAGGFGIGCGGSGSIGSNDAGKPGAGGTAGGSGGAGAAAGSAGGASGANGGAGGGATTGQQGEGGAGGAGASGRAGTTGAAGGSAGSQGVGGRAGAGGATGPGGGGGAGAAGAAGTTGVAGTTGGAGGAAPGDDPCTSADPGNSNPSTASPYVLGTTFNGCIRSGSDTDYISFITPSNPAGGYVVASFTAPGLYESALTVDSYLYLASNTMIAYDVFEMSAAHPGDSLTYWFAAAPATAYVLRVVDLFGMTFQAPYTFSATFTPVLDSTKPNDSESTATMITLGSPVKAYEFHGYTNFSNTGDGGWKSFYQVNLAAMPATVQITNVPAELIMDVYVYGNYSAGEASILGYGSGGAAGAPVMLTTNQSFNAGPHYVLVEATFNPQAYGGGSTPASYVLKPYTLVVTQ
jgi:hypothetical protein